ncbi:MAG: alpha-1,2-fucosyltransferase [Lachnospiraceae bacterium]|nr:alpha-1,2-fucosyltransferase [Lachnospiraceae bacterium]
MLTGTALLPGQGMGNRLFCYVSVRSLSLDAGEDFFLKGAELMPDFLSSAPEGVMTPDHSGEPAEYREREERIYIGDSVHDMLHGCYVAGKDPDIRRAREVSGAGDRPVLISGNLQDESYFSAHRQEVREWLKVSPDRDNKTLARDNVCLLNVRCGEYVQENALFLKRSYWQRAMEHMRKVRSDMEFHIVTDDTREASKLLPGIPVHHGEVSDDYSMLKNAHYLILSNSSFGFFPAYTSENLRYAIAPMHWARYNTSDGFWSSEQNIYSIFTYMDRQGGLHTPEECRELLESYKAGRQAVRKTPYDDGCAAVRFRAFRDRVSYLGRRAIRKYKIVP